MRTLVINTGSSSLKLSLLEDSTVVEDRTVQRWHGAADDEALRQFISDAGQIDAVGHRVVHGGPRLTTSVLIDDAIVDYLGTLTDLAPLHEPNAVAGIELARSLMNDVSQIACFDTSFHSTMPPAAYTYPLPKEWNQRWDLRRYGFHGLSHSYLSHRVPELVEEGVSTRRVISCHLGSGASICAIRDGESVDTTMGFTPLEGLMMGTRSGSIDPGLIIWLQEHGGLSLAEVNDGIERRGGLAGLSGTSGDIRDVEAAGDDTAALALAVYRHRLAACTTAMLTAAGGIDVLAFTGGVGEHDARVRSELVQDLSYLGLALDADTNRATSGDAVISADGSSAAVAVITCREDLAIEREVSQLVDPST